MLLFKCWFIDCYRADLQAGFNKQVGPSPAFLAQKSKRIGSEAVEAVWQFCSTSVLRQKRQRPVWGEQWKRGALLTQDASIRSEILKGAE